LSVTNAHKQDSDMTSNEKQYNYKTEKTLKPN